MVPENFPILGNITNSGIQSSKSLTASSLVLEHYSSSKVNHQLFQPKCQYNCSSTIIQYPAYTKDPNFHHPNIANVPPTLGTYQVLGVLYNPYFSSGCALKPIYVPPNSRPGTTSYQASNVNINNFNVLLRTVPANE